MGCAGPDDGFEEVGILSTNGRASEGVRPQRSVRIQRKPNCRVIGHRFNAPHLLGLFQSVTSQKRSRNVGL